MIRGRAARALRPDPEIARALAPVARRVLGRFWLETGRSGLTWALAWACAVLLVARFLPLLPGAWVGAGTVLALAAWAILGWRGRPDARAFAAAADGLGLQERAITALELGSATGGDAGLGALVRADALSRLAVLDARSYPLVIRRRTWSHLALLAGVAAVLAWLPNPMAEVAARRAEERAAVRQASAEVKRLQRQVADEAALTGDRRWREAQEVLRRLQRELGGSREQALRALAGGKEGVARLAKPEERAAGPALSALGRSWQQGVLGDAGRALAGRDWRGAREALKSAGAQASPLSPEAREALARAIQEGAAAARSLPRLSEALQRAASAVADGDGQAMAEALSAAGKELEQAGELADAAAGMEGLLAELDRLAALASAGRGGALASGGGAAGGTALPSRLGPASGSPGQGGGAGSAGGAGGQPGSGSNGNGNGAGAGTGTGGAGQGSGSGQGTGTGTGTGSGQPGGGGGGMGPGPAGFGASSVGTGEFEQIFDPQLLGGRGDPSAVGGNATGASGEQVDAPWSPLGTGSLRPYQDVFTRYEADARQSMTRINLPPGLREFVRNYFSSLAPAGSGGGQGAP